MSTVMWGETWYSGREVEMHAARQTAELRRALRDMTAVLQAREWAEHVSRDPDIEALEAEITVLVGRANAGLSADFKEKLRRFERSAWRMGELWERCQGKGWPDKESTEFIELRDERMPAIRAAMRVIFSGEPLRECCNGDCDWIGYTDRMCGSVGPLCPDCGEVTEPVATGVAGAEALRKGEEGQ